MKLQQEPKGSHQGYVHRSPWHRVFKASNHCPGSESIIGPNPEGRITAEGDQWPIVNTSTRVHGDCEILMGDDPPCEVMGIPPELAKEQGPIWIVGPPVFFTGLIQDAISGSTYMNMMTCSMSLVGLRVTPSVGDQSMPTCLGEEDMDSD